jgi:hypothetical protein
MRGWIPGALPGAGRVPPTALVVMAVLGLMPGAAAAAPQVQVSPGPLSRAHAALEGLGNCAKCHDAARAITPARCLTCHAPIAGRIARRSGVHRAVKDTCATCHKEHQGVDTDLRRIDRNTFDHAAETGFAIEGLHAKATITCASCHKTRSFLKVTPACQSCHQDPHKGSLSATCTTCHSPQLAFKRTREQFDHARARFALTGSHQRVACEKCHKDNVFRGLRFDECSSCHQSPHRKPLGPACATCHTTERWAGVSGFDHAKTAFTLVGAHRAVACEKCHVSGVKMPLRFDRCSSCHTNVHRDSIKDDCRECHTEETFRKSRFDHRARTGFPLDEKHAPLACRQCHTALPPDAGRTSRTTVDFAGLNPACVSCHKDQHAGKFGPACDSCHRPATFKAAGFAHPRRPEFFAGRHQGLPCERCHVRATSRPLKTDVPASAAKSTATPPPSPECLTCHADTHMGQVGTACDRCHAVDGARFAPVRFSHDTTPFPLSGKHKAVLCAKCHVKETGSFPTGTGTATRLRPMQTACATCHKDPHMGQVDDACGRCHTADGFTVTSYAHPGLDYLFSVGNHNALPCAKCHKRESGRFPAGQGTTIRLTVARTCVGCHP